MDNLLEALKTGSAFAVGRDGKGRKRTPRAAGGNALTLLFLSLLQYSLVFYTTT